MSVHCPKLKENVIEITSGTILTGTGKGAYLSGMVVVLETEITFHHTQSAKDIAGNVRIDLSFCN